MVPALLLFQDRAQALAAEAAFERLSGSILHAESLESALGIVQSYRLKFIIVIEDCYDLKELSEFIKAARTAASGCALCFIAVIPTRQDVAERMLELLLVGFHSFLCGKPNYQAAKQVLPIAQKVASQRDQIQLETAIHLALSAAMHSISDRLSDCPLLIDFKKAMAESVGTALPDCVDQMMRLQPLQRLEEEGPLRELRSAVQDSVAKVRSDCSLYVEGNCDRCRNLSCPLLDGVQRPTAQKSRKRKDSLRLPIMRVMRWK